MVKWTPSGRKRPPKGKFVATRESLKSGLDLDPEVAATYEENWGTPALVRREVESVEERRLDADFAPRVL